MEEGGARLFSSGILGMGGEAKRHKLRYRKLPLSIRKAILWRGGSSLGRGFPYKFQRVLGDVKNPTGQCPGKPAVVGSALNRWLVLQQPVQVPSKLNYSVILPSCAKGCDPFTDTSNRDTPAAPQYALVCRLSALSLQSHPQRV